MTETSSILSPKSTILRLAGFSILVGIFVMALKFVAWRLTGSVALYSDAMESIVNVVAAAAAFWAISVSHRPADHDHQHGQDCGHVAVPHGDHVDYVHDGHRHSEHDGHWDDH